MVCPLGRGIETTNPSLQSLSLEALITLAAQLRQRILCVVTKNGGHLASNLGVVELTIALHRVFDYTQDRLIFDVSHQCYAHKLLTGRDDVRFDRLRQRGGLSGFCNPAENCHDIFQNGHAGTALSSALGLAIARDRQGQRQHIVALLGDGTFSCGLTLEALNQVSTTTSQLIIILNDNGWSIDKNGGHLAQHFHHLAAKSRPCSLFELCGMRYMGPLDGHDIGSLEVALKAAKEASQPVLVHVKTRKGEGYPPAVENPEKFHGIGAAEATAISPSVPRYYSDALGKILCHLAQKDSKLVAITAAMASGTGLSQFRETYPERFFDVGIAEGHAVTFAAGLAKGGLHPVCAIYSTFMQRAIDNVFHDVCLQGLPVIFCMDRAGISCGDGDTHHGIYDIAQLASLPGMAMAQPDSAQELYDLIFSALYFRRCLAIRYPKMLPSNELDLSIPPKIIPFGTAAPIREGNDISLWPVGCRWIKKAQKIAEKLEEEALSVEIIHSRFIFPLDKSRLRNSLKCRLLVTLEDHVLPNGFGSLLASQLAQKKEAPTLQCFGWQSPVGFAESIDQLERPQGLENGAIAQKIAEKWQKIRQMEHFSPQNHFNPSGFPPMPQTLAVEPASIQRL